MIAAREELADLVARRQAAGDIGVLTNGVFDLLHAGHLRTLAAARALGDFLIVAVNSDRSARRLAKGPGRPLVPEALRAELLDGLRCVDYVVLFDEDTAAETLAVLRPAIYVKSAEYATKPLPERAIVEGYGGRVELLPVHEGLSTSELVRRIVETARP